MSRVLNESHKQPRWPHPYSLSLKCTNDDSYVVLYEHVLFSWVLNIILWTDQSEPSAMGIFNIKFEYIYMSNFLWSS